MIKRKKTAGVVKGALGTAATVTAAFGSDLSNDTSTDCNPTALVDVIIN